MNELFRSQSWLQTPTTRPLWMGIISYLILLYGVFFLHWKLESVVWLLWFEVLFVVGSGLIRAFFALQGAPFWQFFLSRIFWTAAGAVLGLAFVLLTVTFTINGIDVAGQSSSGALGLRPQLLILFINYLLVLLLHYFANQRFRQANPAEELMKSFVYLLILLALIMPITMHLLPRFPEWRDAKWVALSVATVKSVVDWGFSRVGQNPSGH